MRVFKSGLLSNLYGLSNALLGARYHTRVKQSFPTTGMAIFVAAFHGGGWSGAGRSEKEMFTTRGQPAAVAPTVIKWYLAGTSLIFGRSGEDPACRGSCGDSVGCNPGDSSLALAGTAPKATRMAATKTAALATACRPRRAPHRRPCLFVGVSISKERRQEQERTGWWTGTSGNGGRRE